MVFYMRLPYSWALDQTVTEPYQLPNLLADISKIELLVDCLVLDNHYSAFFDD
jgi:hypothetical protein